jgi:predicted type IV restriction endonuclease
LESLDGIKKLGFDLNDLKKVRYVLNEISFENEISPLKVKKRFFQILSRYEKNVESDIELKMLENSISELDYEIKAKRSILFSQASIGTILHNLLNRGLNEDDILLVRNLLI